MPLNFNISHKKRIKTLAGVTAAIILIFAILSLNSEASNKIFRNRLTNRLFRNTIISFEKIGDIFFLPYLFRETKLSTLYINIQKDDLYAMNNGLPENIGNVSLTDENKIETGGFFKTDDYSEQKIKIRYRGNLQDNWINKKKSFAITFPKDKPYKGLTKINLIRPSDRGYTFEMLNKYRAQKFGILSKDSSFVRLSLNGEDHGVYLMSDQWSQEWIERREISSDGVLWGANDGLEEKIGDGRLFSSISLWKNWGDNQTTIKISRDRLEDMISLVNDSSDREFARTIPLFLDLEKLYRWNILAILAGSKHQMEEDFRTSNIILFYNGYNGRFEPVLFNLNFSKPEEKSFDELGDETSLRLIKRTLLIPDFKKRRDEILREYLTKENMEDDLRFYDEITNSVKKEFLADFAKLSSNFSFLKTLKENRDAIIDNFNRAKDLLDKNYINIEQQKNHYAPTKETARVVSPIKKVSLENNIPLIIDERNNSITIPMGKYLLQENLIIPINTKLIFQPGVTIFLNPGVSVISYSPIYAIGTKENPIKFLSAKESAWGSVAIVSTNGDEINKFQNTIFNNGQESDFGGIHFSGMLSIYGAGAEIKNSSFKNSNGEDGLNIKGGDYVLIKDSLFENSHSDGIDLDFSNGHMENIQFANIDAKNNNGGDAIDLSWSNMDISNVKIDTCGDKGISIGEKSRAEIKNSYITDCKIGIAVKDSSHATTSLSQIINNKIAIAVYNKKRWFENGKIYIGEETTFLNNQEEFGYSELYD